MDASTGERWSWEKRVANLAWRQQCSGFASRSLALLAVQSGHNDWPAAFSPGCPPCSVCQTEEENRVSLKYAPANNAEICGFVRRLSLWALGVGKREAN